MHVDGRLHSVHRVQHGWIERSDMTSSCFQKKFISIDGKVLLLGDRTAAFPGLG